MTRDLFVSAFAPVLGSGRALRTYTTVRALAALGPLDLAYVPFEGAAPSPEFLAIDGIAFHEIAPSRGASRAAAYVRTRARAVPADIARATSPELVTTAQGLAGAPGRGRVIAGDLYAMTALLSLARSQPVIYNAHNVESAFQHADARGPTGRQRMVAALERRILGRAAESWMVSHTDMARARKLVPEAPLRYVPNVVDVGSITSLAGRGGPPEPTILMVADYTYGPNASGLALLAQEIMPRVWRDLPQARLLLVGRGADPAVAADERISILGFVDDLAAAYAGAVAVAVPLTEGAGTPLKFVEALAYGKAIVATPLAAAGLEVEPGVHFACGADPASFAAELVGVLRDRDQARELGVRARELAEREYSVETLTRLIAA